MGREDQKEEREVLDSIFPDEITDIDENSFRVAVSLDLTGDDDEDDRPTLWLTVSYPETYPDVGPRLDIGLPPNAARIPDLDISTDKPQLLTSLDTTIEENLGMAMVFTLVSALKETAETLIADRRGAVERERQAEAARLEEKENEKFHGTPVTAETFLAWRDTFRTEMAAKAKKEKEEKEAEEKKRGGGGGGGAKTGGVGVVAGEGKLSGRQLWERGIAGKAGEEELEDEDAAGEDALKGVEKLNVKA